jgi:hypothetical protein
MAHNLHSCGVQHRTTTLLDTDVDTHVNHINVRSLFEHFIIFYSVKIKFPTTTRLLSNKHKALDCFAKISNFNKCYTEKNLKTLF